MRHALLAVVVLSTTLTVQSGPGPNWPPALAERLAATAHHRLEAEAKRAKLEASAQVLAKGWAPEQGPSPVDVLRYDLDLRLDPEREVVDGVVEVELAAAVDELATVELDADRELRILGVALVEDLRFPHDGGCSLPFAQVGDRLQVELHRSLALGERVRILVSYHGRGGRNGLGLSWNRFADGTPLITSFSQPLFARLWWPCNDRPDDKALVSLTVAAPSGLTVASNGLELGQVDNGDGTATTRFSSRYPVSTYLVVVNVSDYVYSETTYTSLDGTTTMPVAVYAYPDSAAPAEAFFANTPDMIAAFAERFGEYPFLEEKYGNCLTPFGGGMEHQTLCSYGGGVVGIEWLNAHETAHQWWGDWVTYDNWKETWLAEGLASYSEVLWLEHSDPTQVIPYVQSQDPIGYFTGPLYDNDVPFSNTVYDKASRVFRMLRSLVGDDAFFAGLTEWRAAHGGAAATAEDLRAAMESASGMDLGWFFQQWVYGANRPHLQYEWETVAGPAVRLTVRQVQTNAALFRLPLVVRVTTTAGSEDVQVRVEAEAEQTFDLPVTATPTAVTLDPDVILLADIGPASDPDLELGPDYPGPYLMAGVVHGAPVYLSLPVTNLGGSDLVISEISLTSTRDVSVVSPSELPWTLAPGESGEVELEFRPVSLGFNGEGIILVSNDPSRDGFTVAELNTAGGLSVDPMLLLASALDFGQIPVFGTGRTYFDIINYGGSDLTFNLALTGSEMGLACASSGTLAPGGLFRVNLTLTPTSVGEKTGSVLVTSNDSLTPSHTVTLAGEGVAAPHLVLDPPALSFGIAAAGQEALLDLRNDGGEDLEVSELAVSGPFELVDAWQVPATVVAGTSRALRVRFTGGSPGAASGRLRIASNDPGVPWAVVPLSALADSSGLERWAFPAAARTPGLGGAYWRTDAVFVNPTADDLALDLRLLSETGGSADQPDLTLSVPAGEMRASSDLVSAMGATGSGGVALLASAPGLVAVSRTFTGDAGATYGQHIPAVAEEDALVGGVEYLLAGLAGNDGFHTNLGVLNLSPSPLTVGFTLFAVDGAEIGSVNVTAAAEGFAQANDVLAGLTATAVRGGFAVVAASDPTARFLAYASVVDDGSHDPTFIPAAALASGPLHAVVPAVAASPGFGGTVWRSELTLLNRGDDPVQVTLDLHPRAGGSPATAQLEVPAGAAVHLDDVVGTTLASSGSGWLEVTSDGASFLLESRTFNDDPAGTYGQFVPAVPVADLLSAGDQAVLPGLTSVDGFRTNLGLVSAAATDTVIAVQVMAEDGSLVGELAVTLPAGELVQLDRVLTASFGHTGRAWATLTTTDPGAAFTAYASVVDEGTGDPVFIPAVRVGNSR